MARNTVPPITDPLGKGWCQPNLDAILIDDQHAIMAAKTFIGEF